MDETARDRNGVKQRQHINQTEKSSNADHENLDEIANTINPVNNNVQAVASITSSVKDASQAKMNGMLVEKTVPFKLPKQDGDIASMNQTTSNGQAQDIHQCRSDTVESRGTCDALLVNDFFRKCPQQNSSINKLFDNSKVNAQPTCSGKDLEEARASEKEKLAQTREKSDVDEKVCDSPRASEQKRRDESLKILGRFELKECFEETKDSVTIYVDAKLEKSREEALRDEIQRIYVGKQCRICVGKISVQHFSFPCAGSKLISESRLEEYSFGTLGGYLYVPVIFIDIHGKQEQSRVYAITAGHVIEGGRRVYLENGDRQTELFGKCDEKLILRKKINGKLIDAAVFTLLEEPFENALLAYAKQNPGALRKFCYAGKTDEYLYSNGIKVKKEGAATDKTSGTIDSFSNIGEKCGLMVKCDDDKPFAMGGDSGAVVTDMDSNPLGILWGGGQIDGRPCAMFCRFDDCVARLFPDQPPERFYLLDVSRFTTSEIGKTFMKAKQEGPIPSSTGMRERCLKPDPVGPGKPMSTLGEREMYGSQAAAAIDRKGFRVHTGDQEDLPVDVSKTDLGSRIRKVPDREFGNEYNRGPRAVVDHEDPAASQAAAGVVLKGFEIHPGARAQEDLSVSETTQFTLGSRVRRGRHWCWGDDDGHGPGTVVDKGEPGRGFVMWDNNNRKEKYRIGYDVELVDEPRILRPDELIAVGVYVIRGQHWIWKDQDGGKGNIGVVLKVKDTGKVKVRWSNGTINDYRCGYDGAFDLEIIGDKRPVPSSKFNRNQEGST